MNKIKLTLEPDADGTLHLPLPSGPRYGAYKVEATVEPAGPLDDVAEEQRQQRLIAIMEKIREANPFRDIKDPVQWQREMREDRDLPYGY